MFFFGLGSIALIASFMRTFYVLMSFLSS